MFLRVDRADDDAGEEVESDKRHEKQELVYAAERVKNEARQQEKDISLDFLFDNSVCLPRPKTVEPRRGAKSAFWQLSAQLRQRETDAREAQERAEAEAAAAEQRAAEAAASEAAFPPPPEMSFEEESLVPDEIAEMVAEQPAPVQEEAPASTSRVELDESLLEWL